VGIKILLAGVGAAALLTAALPAAAQVVLQDNFDSAPQILNWAGDSVFASTSAPASVDLIGTGFFDLQPGHGNYLDLDGSTGSGNNPAGQITSVDSFAAGAYSLSFLLGGNDRISQTQSTTISLGDWSTTITPGASDPFTQHDFSFTTNTAGQLTFTENGPSNQQGNLLDDVKLTAVPEPASWALMLVGFGGLGAVLRSRRSLTAVAA
jgi:PEP-CTERM motif-containing protein